ncbi:SLC13 family permease [Brumimicrobium glaciale]|jgi:di/tricarboxylate transporter|uniref:SLC13 family permease n=1 Tax=Brumimicrobium glaciale TaxID=200475 RepID=A0A4Q4KS47_9FLAO|nr:SLC13 family permease [Brumimicrobium glaciale]RYM35855.1 SLC13 family permease [Brumimicrobium glaciale]
MTFAIGVVIGILILAFILFASEKFTVDKTAFFILVSLLIFGIVTPEEAVSGFSDNAVLTILCLMIIAIGLEKNGVVSLMAQKIIPITKYPLWFFLPLLMITVGFLSSFVATTAVVIIFIKLVNELDKQGKIDRSRVLLPISFAGILGGSCTLMGTSTNLIVSDISRKSGIGRFGFFEFSAAGAIFLLVSIPIIYLLSKKFLPRTPKADESDSDNKFEYITAVKIKSESKLIGKKANETAIWEENDIRLVKIQRGRRHLSFDLESEILQENDILWLDMTIENITSHTESLGLKILGVDQNLIEEQLTNEYHEVIVLPNSRYINMTIEEFNYSLPDNVLVKGVSSSKNKSNHGSYFNKFVSKKFLIPGNRVLLSGDLGEIQKIAKDNNLLFANTVITNPYIPTYKKVICLVAILMVVVLSATNTFSILKSCLLGVGLVLFTGCIQLKDAYAGINWQVIFLLAGMIPLGVAMKNTGTDVYIAEHLFSLLKAVPTSVTVSIIFAFTMLMSGFVSNNATAIIVAPIVIAVAAKLGINPKPLLYAVMFGANFSFYTPMGYQTNAIIYGMGIYRFKHFLIIGGVLSIVLLILASILLPIMYL